MTNNKITVIYADIVAYADTYIIVRGNIRVNYSNITAVTWAPHSQSKLCREHMKRHEIPVYEGFSNGGAL